MSLRVIQESAKIPDEYLRGVHADLLQKSDLVIQYKHLRTAGVPLYCTKDAREYRGANLYWNSRLLEAYGVIHRSAISVVEREFGVEAGLHPEMAVPGFQIFSHSPSQPYNGGMWHVDKFDHIPGISITSSYSMTLALGHGQHYGVDFEDRSAPNGVRYFEHRVGHFTIFPSGASHRIAAPIEGTEYDQRLTFQCHVQISAGIACLFW